MIAPRQCIEAELAHGRDQRRHRVFAPRRHAAAFEHDRIEAALLERIDRARVAIPAHDRAVGEAMREIALEQIRIERRGGLDQAVALVVAQIDDDQPRLAVQRAVVAQARAAAVRELVAARVRRVLARDAVGIGVQEQVAGFEQA